jgi:hypothetical protein
MKMYGETFLEVERSRGMEWVFEEIEEFLDST